MPEYIFDYSLDEERWDTLDPFTKGYIECAFWTGDDEEGIPVMGLHNLAQESLDKIVSDCISFQELALEDLEKAYDYSPRHYDASYAGHDFWLTRNSHGTGFWDRGFGGQRTDTVGGRLSRDAKSYGECNLYVGDDGKVYVS